MLHYLVGIEPRKNPFPSRIVVHVCSSFGSWVRDSVVVLELGWDSIVFSSRGGIASNYWTLEMYGSHEFWTVGPSSCYELVWVRIYILVVRVIHFDHEFNFSLLHNRSSYFSRADRSFECHSGDRRLDLLWMWFHVGDPRLLVWSDVMVVRAELGLVSVDWLGYSRRLCSWCIHPFYTVHALLW